MCTFTFLFEYFVQLMLIYLQCIFVSLGHGQYIYIHTMLIGLPLQLPDSILITGCAGHLLDLERLPLEADGMGVGGPQVHY